MLLAVSLFSCASKPEYQSDFPQEIAAVYFQKASVKPEDSVTEIRLYLEFTQPLAKDLQLMKIYFHNQEAKPESLNSRDYKAVFFKKERSQDLIMEAEAINEYGNKPPLVTKPKFKLQPDEAMVEYTRNNAVHLAKITNIKEREMISLPPKK
ncbi:hypothetical protein D3C85_558600 [compost metagenome]